MREHRLFLPSVGEISLRSSRPELNLEQGVFHPRHYQYAFNDKEDLKGLEDLENFIAKDELCSCGGKQGYLFLGEQGK